ncbi:MAG: thermonuclease family protein [Ahrensia sp.]
MTEKTVISMARRRYNRGVDYLKTLVLFALVAIVAAYFSRLATQHHTGKPSVIDGDSVRLDGIEMRLVGIDAPEFAQTCQRTQPWACGRAARDHLASLLGGGPVQCSGGDTDQFDRLLVRCTVNGQNINAAMVRDGFAVAFGEYEALEAQARAERRGLWASEFERPAQWRAARRGELGMEPEHVADWWRALYMRVMGWWANDA